MERFLLIYLGVTGVGAALVLAMPWLVLLGLFAFVLPGLIMGLMPSAFMYGSVFASGWFAARGLIGDGLAVVVGLAAVAAVALLTTQQTRARDLAAYRATILPDIAPAQPIALKGHVRFDLAAPKRIKVESHWIADRDAAPFECDSYCLAALFTPGVTQVTINQWREGGGLARGARTFRLVPRPDCESNVAVDWPAIRPPLSSDQPRSYEDGKLLVSEWAMTLANDVCLVAAPADGPADYTIVERSSANGAKRGDWDFGPGIITTRTVEILERDTIVYRAHLSTLSTIERILFIMPEGDLSTFRFQLSRQRLNSRGRFADVPLDRSLGRHTNLAGRPRSGAAKSKADMLPALRQQLATALADPEATADSPSFQVIENYLGAVGSPAEEEDVALIRTLVGDRRFTRFPGIWSLRLPVDQARPIYDSYTARLVAEGMPMEMRRSLMGKFVEKMGADAAGLIGVQQRALIDDPKARLAVPELVRTLGYGAAENGRTLAAMLKHHAAVVAEIQGQRDRREIGGYGRQDERDAQIDMLGAVKSAFCLLAPRDPVLLADLDAFLASGAMPPHLVTGYELRNWHTTLVRMGKPIASITKPQNLSGGEAGYRRSVQEQVDRWRPDRCRARRRGACGEIVAAAGARLGTRPCVVHLLA